MTTRSLCTRFNEHRSSFKNPKGSKTYLASHYSNTQCSNEFVIQILETFDPNTTTDTILHNENKWMNILKTQAPYGLNTTDRRFKNTFYNNNDKKNCASTYSHFYRNTSNRNKIRGKRNKKSNMINIDANTFIMDTHQNYTTDPKTTIRCTHYYLMSCSKANIKRIYFTILNRNSSFMDKFIRDICTYRLGNRAQYDYYMNTSINRKKNTPNIVVEYCNKGMDLIRQNNLFKIPFNIDNLLDNNLDNVKPTIRYTYNKPFGLSQFNYKQAAILEARLPDNNWKNLCICDQFPNIIDKTHKHIITGDMDIIHNSKLKTLFQYGPNFRIQPRIDMNDIEQSLRSGIVKYIKRQINKHEHLKTIWLEIQHAWSTNLDSEIKRIKENVAQNNKQDTINHIANKADVEFLKKYFVITRVDKASQNFGIICKRFYINKIKDLLDHQGPITTYKRINDTVETVNNNIITACKNNYNINIDHNTTMPYIQITPKFHKNPVDFRVIIASVNSTTQPISALVCNALKLVQLNIKKYCKAIEENIGINTFWIIDNHEPIINTLNNLSQDNNAKTIQTYDFGQMYTNLLHEDIMNAMHHVLSIFFRRIKSIWVDSYSATFHKSNSRKNQIELTKEKLLNMIHFIIHNTYFQFGNNVYRQCIGLPMGTTCAPFLANLTLFSYEFIYITKQLKAGNQKLCNDLNYTFRYIDDISTINDNNTFENVYKDIYPSSLTLKKVNNLDSQADILDINVNIVNRTFTLKLFDKRQTFPFKCNILPHFESNLSLACFRNVIKNELNRILRITSNYDDFESSTKHLQKTLRDRRHPKEFTTITIKSFFRQNRYNLCNKFSICFDEIMIRFNDLN